MGRDYSWIDGVTLPTDLFGVRCLYIFLACENIRFSSLFAAGDVSRGGMRFSPREERGETDVFAGSREKCDVTGSPW